MGKYHTEIYISHLSEVIALSLQPPEYIAVIVVRINHNSGTLLSTADN